MVWVDRCIRMRLENFQAWPLCVMSYENFFVCAVNFWHLLAKVFFSWKTFWLFSGFFDVDAFKVYYGILLPKRSVNTNFYLKLASKYVFVLIAVKNIYFMKEK